MSSYDHNAIESKWQQRWLAERAFRAASPGEPGSEKPPFYALDFFPYPSGAGLHVGHPLGYIASDILSRYKRMRGFNVLHPMGWDAFGLPAEQYAVEHGVHPALTTRKNIATYKRQLQMIGLSYDWERELATSDPDYYRWTQWIFLKIYQSWYDPEYKWSDAAGRESVGGARPIDKLPVPPAVRAQGAAAVRDYRDQHRLAYLAEVPVNWCPALGTVLANEEVTADGRSERGNHPVFRRPMKQWMLRITEYAERLLNDLDELSWPEPIKLMQRNWIGRSEGAYIDFALADDRANSIRVYSTRPDTLFGATFLVLAPEHRLVPSITTSEQRQPVEAYVRQARNKSDLERTADSKVKSGVFTGAYAINPANHARVPIWIADYVLAGYGTGSIMAVPGSDKRDLEFAEAFGLPVIQVVRPVGDHPWRGHEAPGFAVNSPPADWPERIADVCELNGHATADAKCLMTEWLEARDLGEASVQYKLRDWLFSRQRYWGEPFPILYDESGAAYAVDESELPVTLPDIKDFKPHASDDPQADPQTPLSRAPEWLTVQRDGRTFQRDRNTMPNWAGSCWYYLRFCDPGNTRALVDPAAERYWAGAGNREQGTGNRERQTQPQSRIENRNSKIGMVDLYLGGAEHAVLHLLYARFWHKVLYDLGYVSTPEPFQRLFNQGYIQGFYYEDDAGRKYPANEVVDEQGRPATELQDQTDVRFFHQGRPVKRLYGKMGKSLKNSVNPDEIIREYGADTLRLYEMYMGPLEASKPWNTRDIVGVHRFLQRVWRLVVETEEPATDEAAPPRSGAAAEDQSKVENRTSKINPKIRELGDEALERLLHKTIKKVQTDIEGLAFNTAIAAMIQWVNEAYRVETVGRSQVERFLRLLAPFAPHVCEELNQRLGSSETLARGAWPAFDEALTRDDSVEIAVQINGKLRGRASVATAATEEQLLAAAKSAVAKEIEGKPLKRSIVVKGRLVNLIV